MAAKTRQKLDEEEKEMDKKSRGQRENQMLTIYLFVCVVIVFAWFLGSWQMSFFWVFFLLLATFMIWWSKVITLTEKHIKVMETNVHRKRALRQSETAEWLNFIINRWWVFSSISISDLIKKALDPLISEIKPSIFESVELGSFSLGDQTPFIKFLHVYECPEGVGGGRQNVGWARVVQPPRGLAQAQQYQIVLEADVGLQSEDFRMVFRTKLGGRWMGVQLDAAIEKLNIVGKTQVLIHLNMAAPFPHVSALSLSFVEKPEVWFSVRMLKGLQMMEIPIIKSWIHNLVMDGLTQALVDPGKIDIKFEATGPTNMVDKARANAKAEGVLTLTTLVEHAKGSDTDLFQDALVEDTRYCQLRLGEQKQHTQRTQGPGTWQDTCSFLVDNVKSDKLTIKCKSNVLLSTYTLAIFEVALADFPFEYKACVEASFEEKVPKRQGGGSVKVALTMEYTSLPSVVSDLEAGIQHVPDTSSLAGVLYVHVHGATGLLGLDRNGYSDPYCIIYNNGKKIKTTHYINRTKNPKWDVSMEVIVGDFTKSMLSFIVYDWDGKRASEDDFLGSAHIVLNKDEPSVIRRSLTLGYNLLSGGQVDSNKLGCISVSVIFRPVPSTAHSEVSSETRTTQEHLAPSNKSTKGFMNTARNRFASLREKKTSDSMGVGDLLSMGHGILELRIIQARDLVPMDSNGFSDPYCDVKIGGERKFTTSTKKKTLNPCWDEFITLQLPKAHENLDIFVWDRDAFFQKDFLGCVNFTLDELKKHSDNSDGPTWFHLQRIQNGSVQLGIKVILDEGSAMQDADVVPRVSPASTANSSTTEDSGVPCSALNTPPPTLDITLSAEESVTTETTLTVPQLSESQQPPNPRDDGHDAVLVADVEPAMHAGKEEALLSLATPEMSSRNQKRHKVSSLGRSSGRRMVSSTRPGRSSSDVGRSPQPPSAPSGSDRHFTESGPLSLSNMYYGLHGQILRIKGLQGLGGSMYCKLRLDNRSLGQRTKKPSVGRAIAKSQTVTGWADAHLGLDFEVDRGQGVRKDALLTFDIKTSHKTRFATKGFMLQDLLSEHHDITLWLPLEEGIELEVTLHHRNLPILSNSGKSDHNPSKRMFSHKAKHS